MPYFVPGVFPNVHLEMNSADVNPFIPYNYPVK